MAGFLNEDLPFTEVITVWQSKTFQQFPAVELDGILQAFQAVGTQVCARRVVRPAGGQAGIKFDYVDPMLASRVKPTSSLVTSRNGSGSAPWVSIWRSW